MSQFACLVSRSEAIDSSMPLQHVYFTEALLHGELTLGSVRCLLRIVLILSVGAALAWVVNAAKVAFGAWPALGWQDRAVQGFLQGLLTHAGYAYR